MNLEELKEKIHEHVVKHGSIEQVDGIFFEEAYPAYVEERGVDEKGAWIKFYGCNYRYKGTVHSPTIDAVAALKRVLIASVRLLMAHKVLLIPLYLFKKDIIYWFSDCYRADLLRKTPPDNEFSPFPKEIIRVGKKMIRGDQDIFKDPCCKAFEDTWFHHEQDCRYDANTQETAMMNCVYFVAMVPQFDISYYVRELDPLSNLNKTNVERDARAEVLRLVDIAIEREHDTSLSKMRSIRKLLSLALLIPSVRNVTREFLLELDMKKLQPDEADVYYAFRRETYDFGGISYKARKVWYEDEDKGHGNVIIKPNE